MGDTVGLLIRLPRLEEPAAAAAADQPPPPPREYYDSDLDGDRDVTPEQLLKEQQKVRPLPGSEIRFYVRGQSFGSAYTDINVGTFFAFFLFFLRVIHNTCAFVGTYYPAVSCYDGACVRVNFGEQPFVCAPSDLPFTPMSALGTRLPSPVKEERAVTPAVPPPPPPPAVAMEIDTKRTSRLGCCTAGELIVVVHCSFWVVGEPGTDAARDSRMQIAAIVSSSPQMPLSPSPQLSHGAVFGKVPLFVDAPPQAMLSAMPLTQPLPQLTSLQYEQQQRAQAAQQRQLESMRRQQHEHIERQVMQPPQPPVWQQPHAYYSGVSDMQQDTVFDLPQYPQHQQQHQPQQQQQQQQGQQQQQQQQLLPSVSSLLPDGGGDHMQL